MTDAGTITLEAERIEEGPSSTAMDDITLQAELVDEEAADHIAKAVSARHSIARKYVLRLRRRHPDATPAEVIRMLERHYATSITTAGVIITAGGFAAEAGVALIPGGGVAKKAGQEAAKVAVKQAVKTAAKGIALDAAKVGAQRATTLLPAGERQLQFEITAILGLAIADIHGMDLDRDQAHALVYGLTNGRVSQQQIAKMAADLAEESSGVPTPGGALAAARSITTGADDWSHWASTLADTLPAGSAQSLVRTVQTGHLETVRTSLSGKQQARIEYGVGAVAGGVTSFVFGREVVNAARVAFPAAPDVFPAHLTAPAAPDADELESEPNRALAALEEAASTTGSWIAGTAGAVGGGVATAAGSVTRKFRSVDLDGDGIPDEPQALTAVKGAGSAIAGAADSVGGSLAGLFKSKKQGRHAAGAPADGKDLVEA